jgi:hypothetical protein
MIADRPVAVKREKTRTNTPHTSVHHQHLSGLIELWCTSYEFQRNQIFTVPRYGTTRCATMACRTNGRK